MLLYPSQADNKMTSNAFDTLENLVQPTQKKKQNRREKNRKNANETYWKMIVIKYTFE